MLSSSRTIQLVVTLVLWSLLSACTTQPSDHEINILVAKSVLPQGGENILALENFRKVNGIRVDDTTYVAEVEYDLVFRKGLEELTAELAQQSQHSPLEALGAGVELFGQLVQYGQFKAGDRLPQSGTFKLIQTEQGWRLAQDFNL